MTRHYISLRRLAEIRRELRYLLDDAGELLVADQIREAYAILTDVSDRLADLPSGDEAED